jgi:pyridinium-3,5-bisthiocarboxylic acid mononucleotide nickel chelatase
MTMKTALLDIFTGISGDMTIAALLDAGASFDYLKSECAKLNFSGYELKISKLKRSQIEATKFDVVIHENQHAHRDLENIFKLIDDSTLSDNVKKNSKRIFETIGQAEAKIHNVPVEKVHFHEVGAIDSIIDIVGACICLENMGVNRVLSTPVKLGKGLINTQHGVMPNPAPATLEILKDYPVEFTNIDFELTTPTGAAIVKTLSGGVYDNNFSGNIKIESVGFGSGTFDIKESPNLLRVMLCEIEESKYLNKEKLVQVETNIDDMNPQIYPYVMQKLFDAGALDVYYHDIIMKKGRPGILLSVLASENILNNVLEIIYSETTTLGVRIIHIDRHKIEREIKEVDSSFGKVKVKVIEKNSSVKFIPEFEECKRLAQSLGKTFIEIYNQLMGELNG